MCAGVRCVGEAIVEMTKSMCLSSTIEFNGHLRTVEQVDRMTFFILDEVILCVEVLTQWHALEHFTRVGVDSGKHKPRRSIEWGGRHRNGG